MAGETQLPPLDEHRELTAEIAAEHASIEKEAERLEKLAGAKPPFWTTSPALWVAIVSVIVLWFGYWVCIGMSTPGDAVTTGTGSPSNQPQESTSLLAAAAQFGDQFGGFTALATALALGFMAFSIFLQRHELSLQRITLEEQRLETRRVRVESMERRAEAIQRRIELGKSRRLEQGGQRSRFWQNLSSDIQTHNWKFLEHWHNAGVRPQIDNIDDVEHSPEAFGRRIVVLNHINFLWQVFLHRGALFESDIAGFQAWTASWFKKSEAELRAIFDSGDLYQLDFIEWLDEAIMQGALDNLMGAPLKKRLEQRSRERKQEGRD